jgi:hypothetical protein
MHHDLHLPRHKPGGQLKRRNTNMIEADGPVANVADKVDVIVLVMVLGTRIVAKGVADGVFRGGYGMEHPFFDKALERPVDGDAVESGIGFFHIRVGQRTARPEKEVQDAEPSVGNAKGMLP